MMTSMTRCRWKNLKLKSPRSPITRKVLCPAFIALGVLAFLNSLVIAQSTPARDYLVYVLSESADRITLVRFGPKGAVVDHDLHIGEMPTDINGPHGIAIAPDKRTYYVSVSHGRPFGTVWKYSAEDDRVLGKVT